MMTPVTPEQAREIAADLILESRGEAAIHSLADQVEALTAERDALKDAARLQYEVDAIHAIKAERNDFSARYENASRLVTSLSEAWAKSLKERDALKDAAWLALDALVESEPHPDDANYEDAVEAIAALKAVL